METYDVMTTTFAARSFTDKPVSHDTLHRILDHARFAPSGGNRQGWKVIIIENSDIKSQLQALMAPTIRAYKAMAMAGETPFNSIDASGVDQATIDATSSDIPFAGNLSQAPVVLIVTVDLKQVTAFDQNLHRVGVIPGASIYPFVWNILLAARNEHLGGVMTTFIAHQEPQAKTLLGIPDHHAIAAMVGIGEPTKQLTKLKRRPVSEFTTVDHFQGESFSCD